MDDAALSARLDEFQRALERRDQDAAAAVLADDYQLVLVHPTHAVMPRHRWLEVLTDYVVHEYVLHERQIDIDGDCASVLQLIDMRATVLGEPRNGKFVISDFWRRRGSEWYLWRRHSTPLEAGELRAT